MIWARKISLWITLPTITCLKNFTPFSIFWRKTRQISVSLLFRCMSEDRFNLNFLSQIDTNQKKVKIKIKENISIIFKLFFSSLLLLFTPRKTNFYHFRPRTRKWLNWTIGRTITRLNVLVLWETIIFSKESFIIPIFALVFIKSFSLLRKKIGSLNSLLILIRLPTEYTRKIATNRDTLILTRLHSRFVVKIVAVDFPHAQNCRRNWFQEVGVASFINIWWAK